MTDQRVMIYEKAETQLRNELNFVILNYVTTSGGDFFFHRRHNNNDVCYSISKVAAFLGVSATGREK